MYLYLFKKKSQLSKKNSIIFIFEKKYTKSFKSSLAYRWV